MILILHIYWIDFDWMKWQRKTKKKELQTRIVDRDTDDYPKDALHLFAENKFVNEHNNKSLSQMPGEKVVIPCHDSVVSANIPAKECQNMINKLPDVYSEKDHLIKPLTLVVGMIVVMTVNVDVEDGLTNGATGVTHWLQNGRNESSKYYLGFVWWSSIW